MATYISGSDAKAVFITADTQALDADGISVAATLSGSGNLTLGGALTSGGSATFDSGRVVTLLSAGDDSGDTFTVTGTDVNGDAQTEEITGANAGTATGTKYFKTVTQISTDGASAGNVSAGINNSAADVIFAGRSRLKGLHVMNSGTAGTLVFPTTSPTGTTTMKLSTVASATVIDDVTIPAEGVLFTAGIYIQYTQSTFTTATVFHA
jgi:hypothetical protein|tara:strand:+ start:73 stop:699 length:627 start_codon:yes stop_codon:yes gene_type:complete